jgi:hypothetical protein
MVRSSVPSISKGEAAMSSICANQLKTQGISAIVEALADTPEATVSVRGKERFVVMEIEHYHYLRECELAAALAESQVDLDAGRFVAESVDAHLARLDAMP